MARIIIKRTNEYINYFRDIRLYGDDKLVGRISSGKTITFEVKPGVHTLQAKIDWAGSKKITFKTGEEDRKFILRSFKYTWIINLEILIIAIVFFLDFFVDLNLLFYLVLLLPGGLLLFYYITFGRYRYLRLTEVR
jgi:hypothetical protein